MIEEFEHGSLSHLQGGHAVLKSKVNHGLEVLLAVVDQPHTICDFAGWHYEVSVLNVRSSLLEFNNIVHLFVVPRDFSRSEVVIDSVASLGLWM